ncbi:MAG: hypothetical protein A3B10_02905 [Candidatus Doudnabacteria bacterium RIFCSPLOWO2_01_FULL_44_21]|uniref:Uncharacterized protein n=1 Tax=Candidatus Doudnabacteria bacterium RIFCSPLOWO2_01_FULL_44_21 TaxID=1817841 RepID=A0A1F5Q291_9BACT|nr:MAG: hypothetical protein A3B95_03170 [Candidatus Doudnabacteria bacterium RIFCSPHIGHO2_02_FULL_43_13b]OGE96237.1 MAG: hypothetical protein A3B10_02905 [Candidatus Doudnabacteria bacterium RIFCSPLOWO2_01_FULL_44_21]
MKKKKSTPISKLELLRYKSDFQSGIIKLRKKWGVPENGFDIYKEYRAWENKVFYKNGEAIISDLNLLKKEGLKSNPVYNILFLWDYFAKSERIRNIEPKNELSVQLHTKDLRVTVNNLNPSTTQEDWLDLWPMIKKFQHFLPNYVANRRSRKSTNWIIAKFAHEQALNGIKHKDIKTSIKKEFGITYDTSYISKLIRRFKEFIEKDT